MPVSYTHLDVYKRQHQPERTGAGNNQPAQQQQRRQKPGVRPGTKRFEKQYREAVQRPGHGHPGYLPVSYTHLWLMG